MAAFVRFESFSQNLASGVHDFSAAGNTLEIYLSNTAPNAASHDEKADVAEISTGNGYTGPVDAQNDISRSGGTTSVTGVDVVITASGAVGPFRYAILFDQTSTGDKLIGYWDYGSSISLANGETFTVDMGSSLFTIGA